MKNVVEVSKSQLNAIYRAASTDVKDMMKNIFKRKEKETL